MIIRTPTRTKTTSFKGDQMDFQFPSQEHLPKASPQQEFDLNNHHLLNDVLQKQTLSLPSQHPEEDATSQILSDYTSTSNTNTNSNSSNGYYSFANISDNTTSPKLHSLSSNSYGGFQTLDKTDYPSTLAPDKMPLLGSLNNDSKRTLPGKKKSQTASSIPTADNISFAIVSASSDSSTMETPLQRGSSSSSSTVSSTIHINNRKPTNLQRVPTIRQVPSINSSSSTSSFKLRAQQKSCLLYTSRCV